MPHPVLDSGVQVLGTTIFRQVSSCVLVSRVFNHNLLSVFLTEEGIIYFACCTELTA